MYFGALLKNSFIDYPNKISCVLFTIGCNLRCPYCHNPELVETQKIQSVIKEDEILKFLKERKNLLDGVVITGGEPLMYPLDNFLKKVKDLGYPIKLDTNGSMPLRLKQYIEEKQIDYVAMDFKSTFENYTKYLKAPADIEEKLKESIKIIKMGKIPYEFRTTLVKEIISTKIIKDMGVELKDAKLWILQKGYIKDKVLNPHFFNEEKIFTDEEIGNLVEIAKNFVSKVKER